MIEQDIPTLMYAWSPLLFLLLGYLVSRFVPKERQDAFNKIIAYAEIAVRATEQTFRERPSNMTQEDFNRIRKQNARKLVEEFAAVNKHRITDSEWVAISAALEAQVLLVSNSYAKPIEALPYEASILNFPADDIDRKLDNLTNQIRLLTNDLAPKEGVGLYQEGSTNVRDSESKMSEGIREQLTRYYASPVPYLEGKKVEGVDVPPLPDGPVEYRNVESTIFDTLPPPVSWGDTPMAPPKAWPTTAPKEEEQDPR